MRDYEDYKYENRQGLSCDSDKDSEYSHSQHNYGGKDANDCMKIDMAILAETAVSILNTAVLKKMAIIDLKQYQPK